MEELTVPMDIWRVLLYSLLVVVGVYACLALLLFIFQSRLLYFPERSLIATPTDVALPFETITFRTSDNLVLHGWFVPSVPQRAVLMYLHGNGGNISHRLESLRQFHHMGLSVLIFDYRGYGKSDGDPTEDGTYRDAQAAWGYLTITRGVQPDQIVLLGRSLGGAIAAWLATQVKPRALIIESTFTSVPDRGAEIYPYFPVRLLSRFEYNTLERIGQVHCPLLVVHSPEDEIVPFNHGEKIFAAAPSPKEFLQISGGHNDGFFVSADRYERGLITFIDRH
jgi:hypothetical protein